MKRWAMGLAAVVCVGTAGLARAQLPAPAKEMAAWGMPWGKDVPGRMSADGLIEKPAGKSGPIVARDGHFYEGDRRIRFWGFSIAFSGCFPTHAQADLVAGRLAHFGINAIRFHHMDNQPYPNGIFADKSLETLSPEALDRLDYFIAALKAQGIYSDLNLHVSRSWSKAHHWESAGKLPDYDKMLDLFEPRLIAAQKQYARDLLTHVNAYTHNRYADEPAVCFLEINNENTLFLWGGEQKLAELPEPYASELTGLWNQWLKSKYGSRQALEKTWATGALAAGPDMLKAVGGSPSPWILEQHESAKASVSPDAQDADHPSVKIDVAASDGVGWHIQYNQPGVKLTAGTTYSLSFDAKSQAPESILVEVNQAHDPWRSLGLDAPVHLDKTWRHYHLGLTAEQSDANARVCFQLGARTGAVWLSGVTLTVGGAQGLSRPEDPAAGSVAPRGFPDQGYTHARLADWYDFLQQTDQAYFTGMRKFLAHDLGVKCPITGTIGLGPLGTRSQSKMDFVDAHSYWDHPQFPHRPWDAADWLETNRPMVDALSGAPLWALAATRVAGKPFTVTEYNNAAPNEWQAECVPMIATYAALQDWDAVILFDYVGSNHYQEMDRTRGFFDFEGNPRKMDLMPMGARIFLSGDVKPLAGQHTSAAVGQTMLDTGSKYYWTIWPFAREVLGVTPADALNCRLYMSFDGKPSASPCAPDPRVSWTASVDQPGSGRFELRDLDAAVFVGFARGQTPIDLGAVRIEKLDTPFATLIVVPADPGETIAGARRLLVSAVARGGNTAMQWDAARRTVSNHWGKAPPLVEVVHATLSIAGDGAKAYALTPDGKRGAEVPCTARDGRINVQLGTENTIWYEVLR